MCVSCNRKACPGLGVADLARGERVVLPWTTSSPISMGGQTRHNGRLLRVVKNGPWATFDDHLDEPPKAMRRGKSRAARQELDSSLPTPPGTNSTLSSQTGAIDRTVDESDGVDLYAEPEDLDASPKSDSSIGTTSASVERPSSRSLLNTQFKKSEELGHDQTNGKSEGEENDNADGIDPIDPSWMTSSSPRKKRKASERSEHDNIHARPQSGKRARSGLAMYGSSSLKANTHSTSASGFRTVDSTVKRRASPKKKAFATIEEPELGSLKQSGAKFRRLSNLPAHQSSTKPLLALSRSSSPLSDALACVDVADVSTLSLPVPKPYVPTVECICGDQVSKLLQEQFEDEVNARKDWTFKWQTRFCAYHKRHEAQRVWDDRGYPQIDWSGLKRRMRKHDDYLLSVLNGTVTSCHRTALRERLKPRTKGIKQLFDAKQRPGALVGYYGPRGENVMYVLAPYRVYHIFAKTKAGSTTS